VRIGLISDTHNYLDPIVEERFEGVDHIVHAGDVGMPWILLQLEQIAPVTAVLGNTDAGLQLRETEVLNLGNRTFLVHHIVEPLAPADWLGRRIAQVRPDTVIFGHTHKAYQQRIGDILFINPGYAGRPKLGQSRTVAVLHADGLDMKPEILPI